MNIQEYIINLFIKLVVHRELNYYDKTLAQLDALTELETLIILKDYLSLFCQIKVDFKNFDDCLQRFQRNECDMDEYLLFKDIVLKRISKCNKLCFRSDSSKNPLIQNEFKFFVTHYSNNLSKIIDTFDNFVDAKFIHQ